MPRLLLVDDNPSIHRIAESLLAPTDVELVCVASAAEALDRIERGERFDVALVDTAMPGMDGWTLLSRLRAMEETARMPIALMAGVLDPVDPAKLAKAPIQGFLKKPIELRELGDRVKALLITPMPTGPSPFSTVPATSARELVKRAEAVLPELRPEPVETPARRMDADLDLPETAAELPEPEADLLVLTADDLWPEDPVPVVPEEVISVAVLSDMHLELEELDLDSLQDLASEPLAALEPVAGAFPEYDFAFEPAPAPAPAPALEAVLPEEDHLVTLSGLEELDALPSDFLSTAPSPVSDQVDEPDDFLAHLPVAASLIGMAGAAEVWANHEAVPEVLEPVVGVSEAPPETHEPALAAPESIPEGHEAVPALASELPAAPAAGGQAPAVPGQAALLASEPVPGTSEPAPVTSEQAPVTSEQARAVVQVLLADPVLVDALVKAVVARMGDQVLREIAWEVMPDLAGRLQR